jgi:hypothetical protein
MYTIGRLISLTIWLGLAALFTADEGINGLGLIAIFSIVGLSVEYLSRGIIRRNLRFSTGFMAGLLASVIFFALILITIAIMSGVDAVESIPRWLWYLMLMYSCAVVIFALRLSEGGVFRHDAGQPPPKAHSGGSG